MLENDRLFLTAFAPNAAGQLRCQIAGESSFTSMLGFATRSGPQGDSFFRRWLGQVGPFDTEVFENEDEPLLMSVRHYYRKPGHSAFTVVDANNQHVGTGQRHAAKSAGLVRTQLLDALNRPFALSRYDSTEAAAEQVLEINDLEDECLAKLYALEEPRRLEFSEQLTAEPFAKMMLLAWALHEQLDVSLQPGS